MDARTCACAQASSALENYMGEVYRGIDCKVSHELYQVRAHLCACAVQGAALRASVVLPVRDVTAAGLGTLAVQSTPVA
jgi:hypothetical protein